MGINEIRNKQAEQTEMCECAPLTLPLTPLLSLPRREARERPKLPCTRLIFSIQID
jgi:hypothetical protein